MSRSISALYVAPAALVVAICFSMINQSHASPPKRVVGYFAEWTGYSAAEIPADLVTHVIYAFGLIKDGEIAFGDREAAIEKTYPGDSTDAAAVRGYFHQLQLLKQKHPHIKTLISIGGWGGSDLFSDMAMTEASRRKFARSCAAFAGKYGFDGVDIDWEYPGGGGANPDKGGPQDKQNFTLLLRELRQQLDEQGKADGKAYLLTVATPASPSHCKSIELDQVGQVVDFINLMTYDFTGAWSELTGFNAPLFGAGGDKDHSSRPELCADVSVKYYIACGVPAEKVVLGVPFYGKAFGGVKNTDHGLFQTHDRKSPRPPGGGEWSYRNILAQYLRKPSPPRWWDSLAKVPWLYDEAHQVMITYDDPESLRLKAAYARDRGLGGVMIWELSHDDQQASLLHALNDGLSAP